MKFICLAIPFAAIVSAGNFARDVVTVVDLTVETLTVYVTASYPATSNVKASLPHAYSPAKQPAIKYSTSKVDTSSQAETSPASIVYAPAPASISSIIKEPVSSKPVGPSKILSSAVASSVSDGTMPLATYPTTSPPDDYNGRVVWHHNVHRANHSSQDISWNQALANTALKQATGCTWAHNTNLDGGFYGQNIAAGFAASAIGDALADFYNSEVTNLGGHMTAMVWNATTHVGCATFDCSANGGLYCDPTFDPQGCPVRKRMEGLDMYTVCNYKETGNVEGEYEQNVGKSKGLPTVYGNGLTTPESKGY